MSSNVEVDMEEMVEHFRHEFRRALEAAMRDVAPQANVDPNELFRAFKRGVRRSFRNSETLPGSVVK